MLLRSTILYANFNMRRIRSYTVKLEPWWTLIGAPISQEFIFRLIPYRFFYLSNSDYWRVGFISSLLYALIHWYFGKVVVFGTFIFGLFLWWLMVNYGLIFAVFVHALINTVILIFWKEKWLKKMKTS